MASVSMCVFRGDRWIGIIKLCHIVYRVSKWALEKLRVVVVVTMCVYVYLPTPPVKTTEYRDYIHIESSYNGFDK